MASQRQFINTYATNAGELSPLLANRQEQARYAYGLKRMRNFIPALQGPARKRPGYAFVAEIADSSQRAWIVPFIFSQRDAWTLEFGDGTLRFYSDHGQVLEATKTITGVSTASQAVLTVTSHGYTNGQEVVIASLTGLLDSDGVSLVNGRNFRISDATTHTFKLKDLFGNYLDTSAATAYGSGGTAARVYEVATPWGIDDLTDADTDCCLLSFTQSQDVLYICVPGFRTQKLTRSAATSWAFSDFSPRGGPFETVDPDNTVTVYAGAATGNTTLTASSGIFTADHVGALFLLEKKATETIKSWEVGKATTINIERRSQGHYYQALIGGKTTGTVTPSHTEGSRFDGDDGENWQYLHSGYGWGLITAYNSATSVDVTVISRIPSGAVGSGNPSTRWAFGSWSDEDGWPTHVTFFRERLTFVRGTRIWASVPSDFENLSQRDAGIVAPDSAIAIDIRSGVNDAIQWVIPAADLLVGTEGMEFSVGEISTADPLGPDNVAALAGPGYGTRRVTPVIVNDAVMYVLPSGRTLRELRFTFETDGYSALNRTAYADHIAKGQIIQLSYQKEPESIVWANCANGDFIGMSYEREHDLVAWHKHPVGGSGEVESQCTIPSPDGRRNEVWAIIKRTINGVTKRYIERSTDHWDEDTDALEDQFYVDSGLVYAGSATSVLGNLHHLEGESVSVLGDGRDLGDFTVTGGKVNLGAAVVSKASVGLAYSGVLESMNIVRPGFVARAVEVWIRFIATVSAAYSTVTQRDRSIEAAAPRSIEFNNITLSAPAQPVTRLVKAPGESGHGRELTWVITHDRPTACTVAGVIPDINTEGRP